MPVGALLVYEVYVVCIHDISITAMAVHLSFAYKLAKRSASCPVSCSGVAHRSLLPDHSVLFGNVTSDIL